VAVPEDVHQRASATIASTSVGAFLVTNSPMAPSDRPRQTRAGDDPTGNERKRPNA